MSFFESDPTNYVAVFTTIFVLCTIALEWLKKRNYPPGPIGLPIVGYSPFLKNKPFATLKDLSMKYGKLFSFKLGPQLMICVSDYHLAKEILNHPMTFARPPHCMDRLPGKGGFGRMYGEQWNEHRRFVLMAMKTIGMGKGPWEIMVQDVARNHVKELKHFAGEPFLFTKHLEDSQVGSLLSLIFDRQLNSAEDRKHLEDSKKMRRVCREHLASLNVEVNLPWLIKVLELVNYHNIRDYFDILKKSEDYFENEVTNRMKCKESLNKDDFIGLYLKEAERKEKKGEPHSFTKSTLVGNLFALHIVGQDATIASVNWLLLLMAQHPDIQETVCREIDGAIGRDETVSYRDKTKLPYTMATIMEMQRWITIRPLFPPRYVMESFSFSGYEIPQGSHIVCNAWAIMHDERYFEHPMSFNPDRFLSKDRQTILKVDGYFPFSFGRRNCPAEELTVMTILIYFVSIMQNFSIRTPDGRPPDLSFEFTSGSAPNDQKLCFIERK